MVRLVPDRVTPEGVVDHMQRKCAPRRDPIPHMHGGVASEVQTTTIGEEPDLRCQHEDTICIVWTAPVVQIFTVTGIGTRNVNSRRSLRSGVVDVVSRAYTSTNDSDQF